MPHMQPERNGLTEQKQFAGSQADGTKQPDDGQTASATRSANADDSNANVPPCDNPFRALPSVEEVLGHPVVTSLAEAVPRPFLVDAARKAIGQARKRILTLREEPSLDNIATDAARLALALQKPNLRRVINASGVVIHTNLGRSVLAEEAVAAVNDVIRGYSTLEYDTETLARGSRHAHCEQLICALTGAEAAIAVNNNASAVMLVLSEFAAGHEAIVSRGELVEIGGAFRIPDIMSLSRARMVEVGTTNKTHAVDYQRAITPETAMLLKVHPSNYRMIGFTESVSIGELREMADAANAERMLVYEDQGSGAFLHLECFGAYAEPTVAHSLREGADLVSFSGDKLLGGPQAGIVVGSKELIDRLKANPLARAVRLDKMTIAALEATLRLYLDPEKARESIPTVRMLTEDASVVRARAHALADALSSAVSADAATFDVVEEIARAGGGALPMCDIPTFAVRAQFLRGDAQDCEKYLVQHNPVAIVARIKHDALLFDARTLLPGEPGEVAAGMARYFDYLKRRSA